MCEIVVVLKDSELSGDPRLDSQRYRRGDVICAVPDDHPFSEAERTHPDWLIVKVPGMGVEEGQAHAAGEPDDGSGRRFRWKRFFRLDLDTAGETFSHPRVSESVTLTPAQVRPLKKRKHPHPDPEVLG